MSKPEVTTTIFDLAHHLPDLGKKLLAYNKLHSVLKRCSIDTFTFETPGFATTIMDVHTVCLYADYNVYLGTRDGLAGFVPAYYNDFARAMNAYDDSRYGWAIVEDGMIIFDEKLTIADPISFYVTDNDLNSDRRRYLNGDEVMVTSAYYETAERLREQSLARDNHWYNKKAVKGVKAEPGIHSKDAKEAFAKKCKALGEAAAHKKARLAGPAQASRSGSGAGSATGIGNEGMDTE
ncbi:hypothetical protein C8R44DRAFT_743885 [Mycena epipterygia]|nr:hypothetical protein C8R44DRAFT_743885 [Mycena epipterygia]